MNDTKTKTGTREWSEHSVNICRGCSNGCLYCYARAQALRFGRIDDAQAWATEEIRDRPVGSGRRGAVQKLDGRIMFPTTHDITPNNLEACVKVARGIIRFGNDLLIVSKPSLRCIAAILEGLLDERLDARQFVTLRFTITSLDDKTSKFWEPNAPRPAERFAALRYAHKGGWTTSLSMEPLLDSRNVDVMVGSLGPYVTETIWIGKGRDMKKRTACALSGTEPQFKRLVEDQLDVTVIGVYEALKDNPKIRWKDSYVKVLRKHFGGTWADGLRTGETSGDPA